MAENADRWTQADWDLHFKNIALNVAQHSENQQQHKAGACITKNNKIISTGYNGRGHHAERNAILDAMESMDFEDFKDCTIYISWFACENCSNLIIEKGIKRVVYVSPVITNYEISKQMFEESGVELRRLKAAKSCV